VRQPLEQMGRVAAQMLLDFLKDPQKPASRIELPTELVVRDSCQVPRVTWNILENNKRGEERRQEI